MGHYSVHIVGEANYQQPISHLSANDAVQLIPEPDNPHDPRAIRVIDVTGATLGYIERDSWITRAMIDDGTAIAARVERIIGGEPGKPSLGVVLDVRTAGDAAAVSPASEPASNGTAPRQPASSMPAAVAGSASGAGKSRKGCLNALKWGGGAMLAISLLSTIFGGKTPPASPPLSAPVPETPAPEAVPEAAAPAGLSADVRAQCSEFLALAVSTGVVASRPADNRLNVDEVHWVLATADDKRVLLQALSCELWGTNMPPPGEYVVAYGHHNGRRMAMLSEVSLNLE